MYSLAVLVVEEAKDVAVGVDTDVAVGNDHCETPVLLL